MLSLILVIGLLPTTASAAAIDDYTKWKQYDPEWNQSEAWPAWQYPYATERMMSGAGCLVTSIAMLIRHYNVIVDDVDNFNPWICNETLKAAGALDAAADLIWTNVAKAYPGFVYEGSTYYNISTLQDLMNQGYACVVQVSGSGGYYHYVAVNSINGNDVYIMDPGSDATNLSYYGSVYTIHYFVPTPAKMEYIDYCTSYDSYGKIQVTKKAYLMSQPCSSGTDSSSTYIESVAENKELTVTGLYMNTYGNLWYKTTAPRTGEEAYIPASHTVWMERLTDDIKIHDVSAPSSLNVGNVFSIRGNIVSEYNTLNTVSTYVYAGVNAAGAPATGREVSVGTKSYELYNSSVDAGVLFNYLAEGGYSYVVRATTGTCYYAANEKTVGELEPAEIFLYMSTFTVGDVPGFSVNTYDVNVINNALR